MTYGNAAATNSTAEYAGLIHRLRHVKTHDSNPLHVVGDSAMALSQLHHPKPLRRKHLLKLYKEARLLADNVQVVSWGHHP